MSKHRESEAERLWKEKREQCATLEDAVILLYILATVAVLSLIAAAV